MKRCISCGRDFLPGIGRLFPGCCPDCRKRELDKLSGDFLTALVGGLNATCRTVMRNPNAGK